MGYALATFVIIFLLLGSGLLLLFYREALGRRLADVLSTRDPEQTLTVGGRTARKPDLADRLGLKRAAETIGSFTASFTGASSPKGDAAGSTEPSTIQRRLVLGGYRGDSAVTIFSGTKVITPVLLCVAFVATGLYRWNPLLVITVTLAFGYLLPDFWLDKRVKARQEALSRGVPDLLDLLVICLEAGLSLDQSALRSSEEMGFVHPVIAEEIGLVQLEVRAGRPRLDAWRRLAERTDVDSVRMMVSVLVQSDQFGTGVSKTLRTFGDTLRTRTRQRIEEQAAKTTVKLIFPLVLFVFPSLFIVLLGPAIITISESLKH
jgi:tight adherence protein C